MSSYEYTVIPAPARGEKVRNAKTGIERFAVTLSETLNEMARNGWEYVRAETLPSEERSGLTSRSTVYHNILVFRRALEAQPAQDRPAAQRPEPVRPARHVEPEAAPPQARPEKPAEPGPAARGPFSAPLRASPKLTEENHGRARMAEPPVTAPEEKPASGGPRLGPANR
ncbi:hypothetical protein SAMN04487972_11946 [Paracoccus halophilus]|uniref:DUF4177 domain-containing protein n=1 Tax=Paracoccus halophilus TaxID=376733 RepID=A0A099F0E7_9RHOB|nr:hypothetical protein [Paracoccus halophilus]KGJ03612.1 hypothetical protein IT41_13420 [Paracoccus halophilus]SFA58069.1 hypothetical protein SAMN04487972_11946 [Paracoccus halophilus]